MAPRDPLRDLARFGYLTGWRVGEIRTLKWGDVDRATHRITLRREHSKNAEPRVIPYADVAGLAALVERRWQAHQVETPTGPRLARHVFRRGGEPIKDFRARGGRRARRLSAPSSSSTICDAQPFAT